MVKKIALMLFLTTFSHMLLASEIAKDALLKNGLMQSEMANFFIKYPELANLNLALVVQIPISEDELILKLYSDDSDDVYIVKKANGNSEIEKTYVPFDISTKVIEGEIHNTLYDTLNAELGSPKVALQMEEAFREDFTNTKGLRVPAAYSFEVIEYSDNGRFIKYGNIIKAKLIIGHAISEKILQQDLTSFLWNLLPVIPEKNERPFYAPVKSSRVSSLFQLNRRHPLTKRHQPHNGIDFVAPRGTSVYPAMEGEIITIGRARAKGKFIVIQHDNGYQSTYDHLKKFQRGLRVGMRVEMNDKLGEVGTTGYSTGAHLHFGIIKDGYYVNPIYLVRDYCYDQKDHYENFTQESEDQITSVDSED